MYRIISRCFYLLLFLLSAINSLAQDEEKVDNNGLDKILDGKSGIVTDVKNTHSVFAELGGNAILYSINYDNLFYQREAGKMSFRTGIGIYKDSFFKSTIVTNIPLELNLLFGKKHHFLEIGVCYTVTIGSRYFDSDPTNPTGNKENYLFDRVTVLRLGYRYQPKNHLPFIRVGFTPLFFSGLAYQRNDRFQGIIPWAGLSIGFSY